MNLGGWAITGVLVLVLASCSTRGFGGRGLVLLISLAEGCRGQETEVTLGRVVAQLEAEIVKLEQETKVAKRYSNFKKYEKIFLRLGATGILAVSRNMQYAETNTVFQGDDDEEQDEDDDLDDDDDDDDGRSPASLLLVEGRSRVVPQFVGEPLFTVPLSYLLQVRRSQN